MTEGKMAAMASKSRPPPTPSLAQGLDPPLNGKDLWIISATFCTVFARSDRSFRGSNDNCFVLECLVFILVKLKFSSRELKIDGAFYANIMTSHGASNAIYNTTE